jgi:HAD superfamily hydrolase (TIGR01509 family)
MPKLKNFLFDLDGVLVDACDWHFKTLNLSLKEICNKEISTKDHNTIYNGLPTKVKLNMLKIDESLHNEIIDLKAKYLDEIIQTNCLFDNKKFELLQHLKKRNGKIACVTNSVKKTPYLILEKLGIINFFTCIISNEDVKNNKPDPEPYNYTVELLNINPQDTLIIEDSDKGFVSAAKSVVSLIWKVPNANYVTLENFRNIFEDKND